MISRRSLLSSAAMATASLGASCARSETPAAAAAAPQGGLPPSIACADVDEGRGHADHRRRAARADREGTPADGRARIDALMLTGGTSLVYFSGIQWGLSERLFALVVPRKGDAVRRLSGLRGGAGARAVRHRPVHRHADVRTWEEHESPYARVAQGLKERGIAAGRLGVEETVRFVFSRRRREGRAGAGDRQRHPGDRGLPGGEGPARARADAARLGGHAQGLRGGVEGAQPGMTQDDFAGLVAAAHDKLGFPGGAGVQVGEYSALPHGSITAAGRFARARILLIDGGCAVEGYASDISRTFVLGKATDKMKQVFEIEFAAQTAALKAARPGVPCEAVDAAARKVIVDAGYGPDYKFFTHRVGHGMGMDGHEWPYLVKGNTLTLAPGMTFSDEPGIYIRGEFGVRLEDDMVITENGAELMTPQSPSLETPFATRSGDGCSGRTDAWPAATLNAATGGGDASPAG